MFGRIGNFIGGELYGRAVTDPNYPFGMIFPTDPLHLVRHLLKSTKRFAKGYYSLLFCGGLAQNHAHVWLYLPYF